AQSPRPLGDGCGFEQKLGGDIPFDPVRLEIGLFCLERIIENLIAVMAGDVVIALRMTREADAGDAVFDENPGIEELDRRIVFAERLGRAATQDKHLPDTRLLGARAEALVEITLIHDEAGGHMGNGIEPKRAKPYRRRELA